jgi:hypothetical protein
VSSLSEPSREEVAYQRARLARRAVMLAQVMASTALWLQLSRGAPTLLVALLFLATTASTIASWRMERRAARRRDAFDHLDRVIGRS